MSTEVIITIGIILLVIGLVSCVLPPLPGPIIAFGALAIAYFGLENHGDLTQLLYRVYLPSLFYCFLFHLNN